MDNNKCFDMYLARLEAAAPEAKKADFREARKLFHSPEFEGIFDRLTASFGKKQALNTFGGTHTGAHPGATRTPEQVKADEERAAGIRAADAGFDSAANTVIKVAETDPGKVDAWVDFRLKPAIERAMSTDTSFATADEVRSAAKGIYKQAAAQYKAADAKAKADKDKALKDSLAYADEIEAGKKDAAADANARSMAAAAQARRDELGSNKEYKYDASMPIGATKEDINHIVAGRRSKAMQMGEDADKKANAADKFWANNAMSSSFSKPRTPEEIRAQEEADRIERERQDHIFDNWKVPDFESVSDKGLREAFESVYGDSSEFNDGQIRAICESCYRRTIFV